MTDTSFAAGRWREESGVTLVELIISISLLLVVLGATMGILISTQSSAANDVERSHVVSQTEIGLTRMTQELRAGYPPTGTPLPTTAGEVLDLIVGSQRVRYDCSVASTAYPGYKECVRYASTTLTSPPSTNGTIVIDEVSNDETSTDTGYTPVFTPNSTTSPTSYVVKVQVPARGRRSNGGYTNGYTYQETISDAIYLRNNGQTNRALGGQ